MPKTFIQKCYEEWNDDTLYNEESSIGRDLIELHDMYRENQAPRIKKKIDENVKTLQLIKEKRSILMWLI